MKSKKLIIITLILSINLIGCGNINNQNTESKDTIKKTVDVKHENSTLVNTNNKKNNAKTVDIHKKQKKKPL
ncbi:hypothetical protein [Clostridium novyi]|uniref:Uncharacterized protein n=1 Tax=Clostridium novyi B str. ATCC 27606 TaxID=1443123 RepID=A0AA40IRH9_CLONO|nr:hypothetical protein [Clostridium novyi]KEI07985.1 hypothetical protein Z958_p0175 [Clostridium novyi B str. NCTC 9691]KEI11386.1 hypothetical protein Z959_p0086 [Clostridium novyi B str. ATCC 27606]